ncbi:hypothetical protein MNBD_GAMMA12-1074 [hydrothermal vent metagenome]|uniref:Uncharacterized protein n=1 Tax=hydrothermal vent metagenome TaxID=652676 RepID=A0A3B0YNZ2_9ZZZZ
MMKLKDGEHRPYFLLPILGVVFTLLVFGPGITQAGEGISIKIIAGKDKASSRVIAKGRITNIVNNSDRNSFRIGDSALKKAIRKYFGKSPNDAYVKSKTPWGDLYRKYNWPQVKRILRVKSARILSITSKPVILSKKRLVNNSKNKATFNTAISETVSNTAQTSWSNSNSIKVSQKIKYEIGFLGTGGGGETGLEYTRNWGKGGSKSKTTSVGSSQGVSVLLEPGEHVVAQLTASRGIMKVRITYDAFLTGSLAINYNPKYKGHHFYSLGVNGVMHSGGIKNSVQVVQDIEVGYYSNGQVVLDPN